MDILNRFNRTGTVVAAAALVSWVVLTLYRKWTLYRLAKAQQCQPAPWISTKDPILGVDLIYEDITKARNHKFLENNITRFKKYGDTYCMSRFSKRIILTREPENIKTVLSLRFNDFALGDRIHTFGPLLGEGIFTTDGEKWANSRKMIRPNFIREQVAHLHTFERLVEHLIALIPEDGGTVDLQDLFFELTIDSATEFLFGHSTSCLEKRRSGIVTPDDVDFASAFNYAQDSIVVNYRLGPLKVFNFDSKVSRANRICHKVVEEYVDKALGVHDRDEGVKEGGRYLFLNGLAQQTGDRGKIRDELMNVLLAGRDTTASLLSNMFFMLAKNPQIWTKLRREVEFLNGDTPTYEQLRDMKYLKYCMNESLRLHPVVPLNDRTAVKDTVLPLGGGPDGRSPVFVPKGTSVWYSVWGMHRREEFWGPDADQYRPERWENLKVGWEYLPFNGGPRICVGQQYALTEAAYVTTRLIQRYSVLESRDPGPWEEKVTLTLCSKNGTRVSLQP